MGKQKYVIGDIVYDELLKQHYLLDGLGWKKAATRAFTYTCLETNKRGMYTVYNINRFTFLKKVAT